ncbi:MAG TPA: hypothetical protein VGK94_00965 [Candidatus Polarisedimenticolia bacterium]|jgi:hypothetical protein
MSRRNAVIPALAVLAVIATGAAPRALSPTIARRIVVQGRILAPSGDGMAGWPVQVIATQRYLELNRRTSGGATATLARAVTDSGGYYSIDIPRDRHYQFWFLRFVDPALLDTVEYLPPEDLEITAMVRRGRVAAVETTIRQHPEWPEVARRVAAAGGPATEKGRILRTLGLPEKTVAVAPTGTGAREEWWYFTKGIVYTFRGAEPGLARRFEPVKPPPAGPAG